MKKVRIRCAGFDMIIWDAILRTGIVKYSIDKRYNAEVK